jgi:hypothetical protein
VWWRGAIGKEILLRRRHIITLGLAVLLMLVLLVALAGPANASAEKKVYFESYSIMAPVIGDDVPPFPESVNFVFSKMWLTGTNQVLHARDWLWAGLTGLDSADPGAAFVPYVGGWILDDIDIDGTSQCEKQTIYVGARSQDDVAAGLGVGYTGIWKMTAIDTLGPGRADVYNCEAHGVAGTVKGWVQHIHVLVVPVEDENGDPLYWLGDATGYYIMK